MVCYGEPWCFGARSHPRSVGRLDPVPTKQNATNEWWRVWNRQPNFARAVLAQEAFLIQASLKSEDIRKQICARDKVRFRTYLVVPVSTAVVHHCHLRSFDGASS